MTANLFSVPIFFIVFRETLEAAIIISVLLGLVEQIVRDDSKFGGHFFAQPLATVTTTSSEDDPEKDGDAGVESSSSDIPVLNDPTIKRRLVRKLRIQIFLGAGLGLFLACAIGAAFIAVWFTQASNLWANTEALWEGVFSLIAALMIFPMALTMLKMDRAKAKWSIKLSRALVQHTKEDREARTGKWVLFVLPLVTVLREGMEAVIFVGGVALGQPATSIPIAAIVGIICGLICGVLIYLFGSKTTLTVFLVIMTNLLLLIGAGLFSKSVGDFQENAFNHLLGADADDSGGTGPGSYDVRGNVWHLDCCSPEDNSGWSIFNALLGWNNNATLGSILSYVFYWIAAIVALVYMRWSEGRAKFFGYESAAGRRVRESKERRANDEKLDQRTTAQVTDADGEVSEETGHHGISTLSRNTVPVTSNSLWR